MLEIKPNHDEVISCDDNFDYNWANNLKYAAFEALNANCINISDMCFTCKKRDKCQVYWIHDAVCGKLGCHWLDLGDKPSDWTKLRRWAEKYYQINKEKLKVKF